MHVLMYRIAGWVMRRAAQARAYYWIKIVEGNETEVAIRKLEGR